MTQEEKAKQIIETVSQYLIAAAQTGDPSSQYETVVSEVINILNGV